MDYTPVNALPPSAYSTPAQTISITTTEEDTPPSREFTKPEEKTQAEFLPTPGKTIDESSLALAPIGPLYVVLCQGVLKCVHWPLPKPDGSLGKWLRFETDELLTQGADLYFDPFDQFSPGHQVFEVIFDPKQPFQISETGVKASRVRLVRKVEWAQFKIYDEGTHQITDGRAQSHNANLWVSGTAEVWAYGGGMIIASDKSVVHAHDVVNVRLSGRAKLYARDKVEYYAVGRSNVIASTGTSVGTLEENATVIVNTGNVHLRGKARCWTIQGIIDAVEETEVHLVGVSTVRATNSVAIIPGLFNSDSEVTVVDDPHPARDLVRPGMNHG